MAITTTADLLKAEILSPIVQNKYEQMMRFMPLAAVDRTLVGQPGDTLKVPTWKQIDPAVEVAEGADIPVTNAEQGYTEATVKKFGRGYGFTDEADIERIGDQVSYGTSEIGRVIAQYGDTELMNAAKAVDNTLTINPTVLGISEAEAFFNVQNNGGQYTIICSPKTKVMFDPDLLEYIKGSDNGTNYIVNGSLPGALGASFALTSKMEDGKAVMVYSSPDDIKAAEEIDSTTKKLKSINSGQAFKWLVKRDVLIETDRNKQNQTNYIYGTSIAAPYVQNPSKVLNLTINAASKD